MQRVYVDVGCGGNARKLQNAVADVGVCVRQSPAFQRFGGCGVKVDTKWDVQWRNARAEPLGGASRFRAVTTEMDFVGRLSPKGNGSGHVVYPHECTVPGVVYIFNCHIKTRGRGIDLYFVPADKGGPRGGCSAGGDVIVAYGQLPIAVCALSAPMAECYPASFAGIVGEVNRVSLPSVVVATVVECVYYGEGPCVKSILHHSHFYHLSHTVGVVFEAHG